MLTGWGTPSERMYPTRVYPNPTCPIYPAPASCLQVRDVSYLPYPIVDLMVVNPMDWITTWRPTNWP